MQINEILKILKFRAIFISTISFIFSSLIVLFSFFISDTYESEIILAPVESGAMDVASQFSGIASLAGINIPLDESEKKTTYAIEVMKSLGFFENFISKYDLYFYLAAVNGWNAVNDTFSVKSDVYDKSSNSWISNDRFSKDGIPSIQKMHKDFLDNLDINVDLSGIMRVSFIHYSPKISKMILENLIKEINETSKKDEISLAKNTIEYLSEESRKIQLSEVKILINQLIQSQVEKIAIANSLPEHTFKTLSKPYAAEERSYPRRFLIFIVSFLFSLSISSLIEIYRFREKPYKF